MYIRILFLSSFLLSARAACADTQIRFLFGSQTIGKTMTFNVPLKDGRFLYFNSLRSVVDKNGSIVLRLEITDPGIVIVEGLEIYVEPGASIQVDLRDKIIFSGSLAAENNVMQNLNKNGIVIAVDPSLRPAPMQGMEQLDQPGQVLERLDSLISTANTLVNRAKGSKTMSPLFLNFIMADIRLYYYHMTFWVLNRNLAYYVKAPVKRDSSIISSPWGAALTKVAARIQEEMKVEFPQISLNYFWCVFDYVVHYQVFFLKQNSMVADNNSLGRYIMDLFTLAVPTAIDANLSGRNHEFFIPNFLAFYTTDNLQYYSPEVLKMYEKYATEFDESNYLPRIRPKISEIKSLVGESTTKRSKGVEIIENFESINTYQELISRFKGKVLYVDIWAMWCGPCIEAFSSYETLFKLKRKQSNFEIVFLSRDRLESRNRWKQFIFNRGIIGSHLIANERLTEDLRAIVRSNEIPRYFVVDKKGKIVNDNASPPGDPNTVSIIKAFLKDE
jgi:thiol-disulfide isomerase/thioredoxin